MIKTFGNKDTETIFNGQFVKKIDKNLQKQALRRLRYIDAAVKLDDLKVPPSNKFEKKKGDLKDFYAIWVNNQFRIIFKWKDGNAYDVLLTDYH